MFTQQARQAPATATMFSATPARPAVVKKDLGVLLGEFADYGDSCASRLNASRNRYECFRASLAGQSVRGCT